MTKELTDALSIKSTSITVFIGMGNISICSSSFSERLGIMKHTWLFFFRVLDGFRISGRLVGFIFTYPDTIPLRLRGAELWPKTLGRCLRRLR